MGTSVRILPRTAMTEAVFFGLVLKGGQVAAEMRCISTCTLTRAYITASTCVRQLSKYGLSTVSTFPIQSSVLIMMTTALSFGAVGSQWGPVRHTLPYMLEIYLAPRVPRPNGLSYDSMSYGKLTL
jgi:hypothetical protein